MVQFPVLGYFFFEDLVVSSFALSLAEDRGRVVDPDPSARGIGHSGMASLDAGNCKGVLSTHEFVGALLALLGKVAVSELVALGTLVSDVERTVEDGVGEAQQAFDKVGAGTVRVALCEIHVQEVDVPVILVIIADHSQRLIHGMFDT